MEYSSAVRESQHRPKMQASPLMFESDDEDLPVNDSTDSSNKENVDESAESATEPTREEKILKGFQTVLMGIPPPPAFTVPQLDCREILKLWKDNQAYRIPLSPGKYSKDNSKKLEEEAKNTKWPDVLNMVHWDVYYNKSTASEEVERLSVKYKERYVGVETSSCVNALFAKSPLRTASARKRARNRAWGHSPGRRLSHLARRRKAFSSANLCSVAGNNNPDKKMIMVEIKKIGNRQRKKCSAKKTKPTPKKKKEPQTSTIKRALFQSPDQNPMNVASKTPSSQCIQRSKRNLFSNSSEKKNEFGKRERPVAKRVSPRKRVNRSLSFQESSQPATCLRPPPIPSSAQPALALTGAHKQKMLWAATNALREEGMGMSHELFRPCMTVLFRTCQRLWVTRVSREEAEGSTSERMLALAKHFSHHIIQELSLDPTSEHMALVYNNSLKMGEKIFGLPSSSIGNIIKACGKATSPIMNEVDDSTKVFENSCIINKNVNLTSNNIDNSVLVTSDKCTSETKMRIHSRRKVSDESSSEICSSFKESSDTKNNPSKQTPTKMSSSLNKPTRSSPRLSKKTSDEARTKPSVCSALFLSTETHGKISEKFDKNTNLIPVENKNSSIVNNVNVNEDVLKCKIVESNPIIKENSFTDKKTPLKDNCQVLELVRRTPSIKISCETNYRRSNVNSPDNVHLDKKIFAEEESENNVICAFQRSADVNISSKEKIVSNNVSVEIKVNSSIAGESKLECKETFGKQLSYNATSCHVTTSQMSCDISTKNVSSPPNNHYDKNEPYAVNKNNTSFLSITSPSKNTFQVTESFVGRRITRSVSTEIQVKKKALINYLFSPPARVRKNGLISEKEPKEISKEKFNNSETNSSEMLERSDTNRYVLDSPNKLQPVARLAAKDCDDKGLENENDFVKRRDSVDSEISTNSSKHSLRNTKLPSKKSSTGRISCSTKSTNLRREIAVNRRISVVSTEDSPFKNTPSVSVCSEGYSADTENCTSGSQSQGSNNSADEKSGADYETNKENQGDNTWSDKNIGNGKDAIHRHVLSVENTPKNQVVEEEPVNRTLQLYRLSTSGEGSKDTEKLLPDVICLEPPKLIPHWEVINNDSEEKFCCQGSPPPLIPHWEQESCSGTSTSLPESIMAHWQELCAKANEDCSDKVMFDFEDTSYEIEFPRAIEDSRASSICAPFDFPLLIDDSKSCFNNILRRSSSELSDQ